MLLAFLWYLQVIKGFGFDHYSQISNIPSDLTRRMPCYLGFEKEARVIGFGNLIKLSSANPLVKNSSESLIPRFIVM